MRRQISNNRVEINKWCGANPLTFNVVETNVIGFKCDLQGFNLATEPLQESTSTKLGLGM